MRKGSDPWFVLICAALLLAPSGAGARVIGEVNFLPCEIDSTSEGSLKAECARLEVPENPQAPEGRRITLQLALVPARTSNPEPDPVVLLAGGPGQSALEAYADTAAAFEPVRRHRHVLLIDQRGTGKSNPLKCAQSDWKDPALQTPEAARRQAEECLAAVKDRADPRFYTTTVAIHDLETVRRALGSPLYNLVGGSYGTRVALEYLRRHESAIRTVVLDAVVPPELALLQDHARNLDAALEKIFAACREDAACGRRFGDPGRTLDELRARVQGAPVSAAVAHPRTHAAGVGNLTDALIGAIVRLYSYQPEAAAVLPLLIDDALRGRPEALIAQGDLVFERLGEQLAHGMELSVVCAEDEPFLQARPEDRETVMGAAIIDLVREQCAVWPRGAMPADFKQPVVSGKPVLLLSGERDPVTPPRYAQHVASSLSNSRYLVLRGQGHTVMGRGCMPKLIRRFIETADPRAPDSGCLENIGAMPAFTSHQGPEP